jgi:dephospho-CoA kinase
LNQRILYITGATGAGKSTVAPFVLLYAIKMLNYNNNAKVVCTVPRIQPAEDNSKQMSKNIGILINKDNLINYIQYETQNKKIIDNLYHPKLILATDGLLYQRIKTNYIIKNSVDNNFISLIRV